MEVLKRSLLNSRTCLVLSQVFCQFDTKLQPFEVQDCFDFVGQTQLEAKNKCSPNGRGETLEEVLRIIQSMEVFQTKFIMAGGQVGIVGCV